MLINLRGPWGWSIFGSIWGLAITGILFKVFFIGKAKKLSLIVYVFMGWLCLIALKEMIIKIPVGGMVLLTIGGILYTSGIIFYVWHRLPYNHAVWHIFVLAGSISHFFSIFFYILPKQ